MAKGEAKQVMMRLVCLRPPHITGDEPPIFGVQDKARALHAGTMEPSGGLRFEFPLTVRRMEDGSLRFSGPYAHGPADDPFIYLGLSARSHPTEWIRRWKISLASITWADVLAVADRDGAFFGGTLGELTGTRPPLQHGGWGAPV